MCQSIKKATLNCKFVSNKTLNELESLGNFRRKKGTHSCTQTCRKLSFDNDHDNEPALQGTAALILGTEILPHINDVLLNAVNGLEKPELTCISEEGIADMDLPDNLLDDFDFNNVDDNDDEVITSCNKVGINCKRQSLLTFHTSSQVKYSISEIDNNISVAPASNDGRRPKRGSLVRHNKNNLSLSTQVIPEISHESQDEEKVVLNNGHHADCNINRHLRYEQENPSVAQPKVFTNRVISVIEEASV